MKTFAIFPSIAFFLLILTLLRVNGRIKMTVSSIVSALVAGIFYLYYWFKAIYSLDVLVSIIYGNFISVIIVIPCLTYLGYSFLINPKELSTSFWIKLIGVALAATLVTGAVFATTMFFSFMNNPMEPIQAQFENE